MFCGGGHVGERKLVAASFVFEITIPGKNDCSRKIHIKKSSHNRKQRWPDEHPR
jgi:hypothetical protein